MVRSNTGDAGRAYFDLTISEVSESSSSITYRARVLLTSRNVNDSINSFSVGGSGGFSRSGSYGLGGVYSGTVIYSQDISFAKQYGSAQTKTISASFSGVEFWGATLSASGSFTIPARAYVAPGTPGSLSSSISSGGETMNISWGTPSAGSASLNGVNIQIGTSSSSPTSNENSIQTWRTSWSETSIVPGQWYYWRVRARNAHNQWGPWTAIQTRLNVPAAPATPTVGSITQTGAVATFVKPANGGTNGSFGYDVEWSTAAGSVVRTNSVGDVTTNASGTLSPNTDYRVRVRAKNSQGAGPWSGYRTFTTSANLPNAPGSPTATRVSDTNHSISWTLDPTTDKPITSLTVQRWDNVSNAWTTIASPTATTTSLSDTGTVANRRYQWQIRTNNATGSSAWSQTAIVDTTPTTPSSLTTLKTAGGDIKLTWVPAASYTTAFEIFESQDGGAFSGTPLVTVSAGTTTYTHVDPNPAVTHQYRVRAVSASPTLYSGYATSGVVQLQAPPNAPILNTPIGTIDVAQNITFWWLHNPVDSSEQTQYQWRWRLFGDTEWNEETAVTSDAETFVLTSTDVSSLGWVAGDTIEWQMRTRGADPSFSPWSSTASFSLSSVPVTTISQPVSTTVWEEPTAYVIWSYFQAEDSEQAQYEIQLFQGSNTTVAPVETATGSGVTNAVALTTVLGDNSIWTVRVRTQSGDGLWSDWDTETFSVEYPEPLDPQILIRWSKATGWVEININNPEDPEEEAPTVVSNDIYRKIDDGDWVKIVSNVSPNGSFIDHEGPVAGVARYRAVAWTDLPSTSTGPEQVLQFVDGTLAERDRPATLYYSAGIAAENVMTNTRGSVVDDTELLRTNLATNPSFETTSSAAVLATNLITNPRSLTTSGTVEVRRNRAENPNLIGKTITDAPGGDAVFDVVDETEGGPTDNGKWLSLTMTTVPTTSAGTANNIVHVNGSGAGTDATTVSAGEYVSVLGYRRGLGIITTLRLALVIEFLDSSGDEISGGQTVFVASAAPTGLWQTVGGSALAPAGSEYVRVYYATADSAGTLTPLPYTAWTNSAVLGYGPVVIETFTSDPSMFEQTFFDGDYGEAVDLATSWTGTENDSESILTGDVPTVTTSVTDEYVTYQHTDSDSVVSIRHMLLTDDPIDLDWAASSATLGVSGTGKYTLVARVRPSRAMTVWVRIGGAVGTEVNLGELPAGEWTDVDVTTTAGAGAVGFRLKDADHFLGDYVDVTQRLLVEGTYGGPYFDGSGVDDEDFTAAWSSTEDGSTSTLSAGIVDSVTVSGENVIAVPSTSNVSFGNKSLRVIASSASVTDDHVILDTDGLTEFAYGLEAGKKYLVSVDMYLPEAHAQTSATTDSQQRRILFWHSDGTDWTADFGPQADNVPGLQRVKHVVEVPVGADGVMLGLGCAGSPLDLNFETFWDALLIEEVSDSATPETAGDGIYFDGDSTTAPNGLTTAWTGTEHASTSTATGDIPAVTAADGVEAVVYQTDEPGGRHAVRYYLLGSGIDLPLNWWDSSSSFPELAEGEYTIGARVRPSRTMTVALQINGSGVSDSFIVPAGEWTEVRATLTTTELRDATGLVLVGTDDHGAGDYVDFDYRMVITGDYSGDFFNGDSIDGADGIFEWVGDVDESTSIKYISQPWPRYEVMSAWLSGGPDFSTVCRAHYDLTLSPSNGLVTRTLHQFAGRLFPIEFSGSAQTYTVEMAFSTNKYLHVTMKPDHDHDSVSAYPEWEALANLRGPHLYRDFEGRRMYVSISNVKAQPRGGVAKLYDVSITVTRTEI